MTRSAIAATLLLLAACGSQDKAGNAAAGNDAAPAEATANASGTAASGNAPAASAATNSGLNMQPGEWEVRTSMTMPGTQAPMIPPTRLCMTPQDVARGNAALLSGGGDRYGVHCDYSRVSISGGHIQGTSTCSREGMEVSMTMDGTVSPTAYEISQHIRTTIRGQTRESSGTMTGRRIGECAAGAQANEGERK